MTLTQITFFLLCLAAVGGFMFFRWSSDVKLKRKLWIPFAAGLGVSFAAFFMLSDFIDPAGSNAQSNKLLVAFGVLLLAAIISRTARFCDQCSAMEVRRRQWFTEGTGCGHCGGPLR